MNVLYYISPLEQQIRVKFFHLRLSKHTKTTTWGVNRRYD